MKILLLLTLLSVTSIRYKNFTRAASLSKQLFSYLLGNWTGEFDSLMDQLCVAIVTVISTCVDAELATRLSSWIAAAMNHLKDGAGLGSLVVLLLLVAFVSLWCLCQMRTVQKDMRP